MSASSKPQNGENGKTPSILLVDDEPSFSAVMGIILKLHGYGVSRALSANQAYQLLEEKKPDLILADVMMPEIDGLTMIRHLREQPAWASIPTVVVSARASAEAREAAQQAGADAFIAKPFTAEELHQAINPLLQSAPA
jgi:CheY-like chemotaxis protein